MKRLASCVAALVSVAGLASCLAELISVAAFTLSAHLFMTSVLRDKQFIIQYRITVRSLSSVIPKSPP